METRKLKISIGSGRIRKKGFVTVDKMPFIDGNGEQMVDYVIDLERQRLPFPDNSADEIHADNVLEHIGFSTDNPDGLEALIFVLNECHRVLAPGGIFKGNVPVFGSVKAVSDITHKRFFVKESFAYITGTGAARPDRPYHPRYADYGVMPWNQIELKEEDEMLYFMLTPRK
jgi:SAM-dependent methyltransferase